MNRIAELRKEKKMSQRQLAMLINCSRGNISDYESGKIQPSLQRVIDIANALEVTIDYLIGRSDDVGHIKTNANLSRFQNELLLELSKLTENQQRQVLGYAHALAGR